ncbi:uncharacterized protein LOC142730620, partial [Rhinoderma darwinii]|uniref:uncharacterized protein LOC142730620 n=1 Tax=Rhinoderma darwinii TaxID=43563 RepID=UPI003F667389
MGQKVGMTGHNMGQEVGMTGHNMGQEVGITGHNMGQEVGMTGHNMGQEVGMTGHNMGQEVGMTGHKMGQEVGMTGHNMGQVVRMIRHNMGQEVGMTGHNMGQEVGMIGHNMGQDVGMIGHITWGRKHYIQVCNNLHVIFLLKIGACSPQLQRLTYTDVYHPWSSSSLQQVAEKLLDHSQIRGSPTSNISRVMSLIHLMAQSYCQRTWPHLPLTSPRAFISFIQIYLKIASQLQGAIDKEAERLRGAVSRVDQVYDVRKQWTKEMEECSQHQQEAEEEKKFWRRKLMEIEEEERRAKTECEELEKTKERVSVQLTRLQSQRHHQLTE